MTPMRRSQNWLPYVFNDLFDNDWMIKANSTAPAINVIESDKDYRVEVAAPGMTKNDFNIKIDENNNLVVSTQLLEDYIVTEYIRTTHSIRAREIIATYWAGKIEIGRAHV